MPKAKYKKYFEEMFEENKEKMMEFMIINQEYKEDKKAHQTKFNQKGEDIKDIVEQHLHRLCTQMEKGQYSNYSAKLADKFLEEVVKYFPHYHEIGMTIK